MTRKVFAFDLETYLIGSATTAPPMVCLSFAEAGANTPVAAVVDLCQRVRAGTIPARDLLDAHMDGVWFGLRDADHGLDMMEQVLGTTEDTLVVGHNVPFDLWVASEESASLRSLTIAALETGRIADTQVRDQMIDIALGQFRSREVEDPETGEVTFKSVGYHLTDLTDRRLGFKLDKGEDSWRLRYGDLAAVPLTEWPDDAIRYAVLDALSTLAVYLSQRDQWDPIPDELRQTRAAWALAAVAGRGLCVDPPAVDRLDAAIRADVVAVRESLTTQGVYRPDGSKDMAGLRARVQAGFQAQGLVAPQTDTGAVSVARQTLLDAKDPVLRALADVGAKERLLTGFIPVLRRGYNAPVVCRYHTLVETGRTSCVDPNVQQLPRYPGVRDAFVPRPGFYLCSVDYDALELHTLAQVCLELVGWSTMADKWAADKSWDPHAEFAADFVGVPYADFKARLKSKDPAVKEEAKTARQRAKAANFGFPGGLGAQKFQAYARTTYQLDLTLFECVELQRAWKAKWPEVVEFQRLVSDQLDPMTYTATSALVQTGFVRGECRYTQGCNTQFQGLAAAGAKEALWRVCKDGAAHGVFPVAFLHDEILAEVPIASAHESAYWLADTMVDAMASVVPGVPITASPALMTRWYKGAEPTHDDQGKLVPWHPPTT